MSILKIKEIGQNQICQGKKLRDFRLMFLKMHLAGGQTVGPGDYSYMCVASLIKCGKSLTLFFLMPSRKGREIKICVFFRAITLFLMNLIDTRNDQIANDVVKKEKKMIK